MERQYQIRAAGSHSLAANNIHGDAVVTTVLQANALPNPSDVRAPRGLSNLPQPANPRFVGRAEEISRLDASLRSGTGVITQAVHGLGGVGKSALALQYAHQRHADYSIVWWIPADNFDTITASLGSLATQLNPHLAAAALTGDSNYEWALGWLQAHSNWLLIFDNASDPRDLAPVIGRLRNGHHLITTRLATGWHQLATRPLRLDVLPPEAASDLLLAITGEDATGARSSVDSLVAELGYLPLAVEQAAAYIHQNALSSERYLDLLRNYPSRMFATPAGGGENERTVARVWSLTLERIAESSRLAVRILGLMAWFAPENIPRDLVLEFQQDPLSTAEALGLLNAYSMITMDAESISMHRLVQAIARTSERDIANAGDESLYRRSAQMLKSAFPIDPVGNVTGWSRWHELAPHAEALISLTTPDLYCQEILDVLHEYARFLSGQSQQTAALAKAAMSVDVAEALYGDSHLKTLSMRNNLANTYAMARMHKEAIEIHERVLIDRERLLGPRHPATLATKNNLANSYLGHGDGELANKKLQEVANGREELLGPDHPDTLASRNTLGNSFRNLGQPRKAIEILSRVVSDRERVLGSDSRATLTSKYNLAYSYAADGQHEAAFQMLRTVYDARIRVLGADHQDTLFTCAYLVELMNASGNAEGAVELLEQALESLNGVPNSLQVLQLRIKIAGSYQKVGGLAKIIENLESLVEDAVSLLGPNSSETVSRINALANAYLAAGEHGRSVEILAPLVFANPELGAARNSLVDSYHALGEPNRAVDLLEELVSRRERVLGATHPDTVAARKSLANSCVAAKDWGRALEIVNVMLADHEHACGVNSREVISDLQRISQIHQSMGNYGQEVIFLEEVVKRARKARGMKGEAVLHARERLAAAYIKDGNAKKGLEVQRFVLRKREEEAGYESKKAIASRLILADSYARSGEADSAIVIYESILASHERMLGSDHREARAVRRKLAKALSLAGRGRDAVCLLERVLADHARIEGAGSRSIKVIEQQLNSARKLASGRPGDPSNERGGVQGPPN